MGTCQDGKLQACAEGYVEEVPILAVLNPVVNGLPFVGPVAFPSHCVLDRAVAELAKAIAVDLEREMATGKGQVICSSASVKGWWKLGRARTPSKTSDLPEAEVYGEKENDVRARYMAKRNVSAVAILLVGLYLSVLLSGGSVHRGRLGQSFERRYPGPRRARQSQVAH
jgi:hypothetical protein